MANAWFLAAITAVCCLAAPTRLPSQQLKPQTVQEYECYVQSAETRMASRKPLLLADGDAVMIRTLTRGQNIQTVSGNGQNPHKIAGAMIYDWIGTIFVPGATLERTVRMLQDYDH